MGSTRSRPARRGIAPHANAPDGDRCDGPPECVIRVHARERAAAGKLCKPWVSLGDVVTLVSKRNPEADRGIPERYTRISVGLEDTADIIADFEQALA